jgi:uncharacterized Fe-S cluster protein YjdI
MSDPPARTYALDGGEVVWDAARCRHAAECVRGLPSVFDTARRPWIQPEHAPPAEVERVVGLCPTRALTFRAAAPDDA